MKNSKKKAEVTKSLKVKPKPAKKAKTDKKLYVRNDLDNLPFLKCKISSMIGGFRFLSLPGTFVTLNPPIKLFLR